MRGPEILGFVSLCPPINLYDLLFWALCPICDMMINGENDTRCPLESANKPAEKLNSQKRISTDDMIIPNEDHSWSDRWIFND